MKFDDIVPILANDDVVMIAGGETTVKKKIKSVIGGVPTYSLYVEFPKEDKEPITFDTLDELDYYSALYPESLNRCIMCDELPKGGYYYDNEMNQAYCCYSCLIKWMNDVHGEGNWDAVIDEFDKFRFYVEMTSEEIEKAWEMNCMSFDHIMEDGRCCREYDCVYVPPYEDIETIDED